MASSDATRLIRRVVVLLDGSRHARAVLDEAAAIAAREQAELVGLFVEDTELLRAASLPFGGEIGLVSGRLRRFEPGSLERRLHDQAVQVRRLLVAAARQHAICWRLEVNRNRLDTATLAVAAEGDLLVLARLGWRERPQGGFTSAAARRIASGARCTVMLLTDRSTAGERPVLALYERSEAGRRTLAEAARLARGLRQELVALLPSTFGYDPQALVELEEWGARHGHSLRCVHLAGEDALALLGPLRRERAGALVMPRDHRLLQGAVGERLFDALEAPLIIVP